MRSMISRTGQRIAACTLLASLSASVAGAIAGEPTQGTVPSATWQGPYPWSYSGTLERRPRPSLMAGACNATPTARVLLAGDSWAQYMWDDDAHNETFDKFGQADHRAVSRSLGSNPGPGYSGPEYAVSGSEAREWVDTADYPWIANVVAELVAEPTIDTVMFSHGGNDAQKAMGVIAVLLLAAGHTSALTVPLWAKVATGLALTAGTALGGWRIVRTVGRRIFSLTPIDSVSSQTSSTAVILGASLIGAPVSTTQVVASSVVGVGAGRRRWQHVRWEIVREMGLAWLTTIPAAALLAVGVLLVWRTAL